MFDLVATGEYYAEIGTAADEDQPEPLRGALDAVCNERFRRIDRFTEMALLGSGRCAREISLANRTGLYISSGFGSIANTVSVQRQIFEDRRVPKPVNFINTLSNSAGYYVARNLGLHSRNMFVSRDAAPTEAAVQIASVDLTLGNVEHALIGIVDEATWPLDEHARRLATTSDAVLAEGSHWFLLQSHSGESRRARIAAHTIPGPDELRDWFARTGPAPNAKIYWAPGVDSAIRAAYPRLETFAPTLGTYMARTAGAAIRFLNEIDSGELFTVAEDEGRIHVMHITKP